VSVEEERVRGRQSAERIWLKLRRRTPRERRALIEESPRLRAWAVVERVAAESVAMANQDVKEALGLAELAVLIAELLPGTAGLRSRVLGYALAHLANAERVIGRLRQADKTLESAKRHWDAGAGEDPGLLNGVWIIWIEATLRRAQERPKEALRRIDEALAQDQGELRARLLYTKARIVETAGEIAQSTALLSEAAALVDLADDPRFTIGLTIQFLVNLCREGRAGEAALHLPKLRREAAQLGRPPVLLRVTWLEARVAAGTSDRGEAIRGFERVRGEFRRLGIAYDYALVSLELSAVLLQEAQTAKVRTIAAELVWVFEAEAVPKNAVTALRVFGEAAEREAATAELVGQVLAFLYAVQGNTRLRFSSKEAGT
jgi:hypothetical protein